MRDSAKVTLNNSTISGNEDHGLFVEEKLKELAETYKTQGIIQPIEINENNIIITGERRWRAAKIAGLKTVPCKVVSGLSEEEKLERRLIENIHHEPLTDLEKAEAIKKLVELKGSERLAASHLQLRSFMSKSLDIIKSWPRRPPALAGGQSA